MSRILSKSFFARSALLVSRDLLGCVLARKIGKRTVRLFITETEGYEGPHDLASHASRGKTPRNSVMFGPAGHFYVYFTYGMHWMLNIVTGKNNYPSAVLLRGAGSYVGPALLTKALRVKGTFNGKIVSRKSKLWFEKGIRVRPADFLRTPRIGVPYAGPVWSKKLYRFVLKHTPRT